MYVIVDADVAQAAGWDPRDLARVYLDAGARLLQLRAKRLASGAFLDLAGHIAADARTAGAIFIVNDRADLAVLAGADGVHVGQEDLPPHDARRVVGDNLVVGFSTHSIAQIERALTEPISYLAIGPVLSTITKATGYEQVGLPLVTGAARIAAARGLPVVAIGGITLAIARQVIDAGAASVAVISDLIAPDPAARVRQYLSALG